MFDHFARKLFPAQGRERGDPHERALETAHVAANAAREEVKDLIGEFDLHAPRFFAENRKPGFDRGRLELGGQSPFEARNQAMLEICDFRRRTIGREHDLFMSIEQRIEGMEKFFLRTLLAAEELDVIDAKQIRLTIAFPEFN